MKETGVFATEEERTRLADLAKKARETPAILRIGKHDLADDAWKRVQEECHKLALQHGLPDVEGFYGMDQTGQFLAM